MKTKKKRIIFKSHVIVFITLSILSIHACSTVNRPARVIDGYQLGLDIGYVTYPMPEEKILKGDESDYELPSPIYDDIQNGYYYAQIEFGFGNSDTNLYHGLKLSPTSINFDIYYQWLDLTDWACGIGAEIGMAEKAIYLQLGYDIMENLEVGLGNRLTYLADGDLFYLPWAQIWHRVHDKIAMGLNVGTVYVHGISFSERYTDNRLYNWGVLASLGIKYIF